MAQWWIGQESFAMVAGERGRNAGLHELAMAIAWAPSPRARPDTGDLRDPGSPATPAI